MAYSIIWHPDFPQRPFRDGYSSRPGQRILSTPTDKGPAKMRLRGKRSTFRTATYEFHESKLPDLDAWCDNTGTQRFGWPDPLADMTLKEVRLVRNGEGDHYQAVNVSGPIWHVTFQFEELP